MVPRSSRHRSHKSRKRKRILKKLSSSVAISSLLLGSAQLVTPTYSEFNSVNEQGMNVQACFIFPGAIEEQRDLTTKMKDEVNALFIAALGRIGEINISGLTASFDGINTKDSSEETASTPDFQSDSSTIEGLEALQSHLQTEMTNLQNKISANDAEIIEIQGILNEVKIVIPQLESIASSVLPEAIGLSESYLKEIIIIYDFIEGSMERAMTECQFEEEFFLGILDEIMENQLETEKMNQQLNDELIKTGEQISEFNEKTVDLEAFIQELQLENETLSAKIADIESQISAIGQQIADLIEIQRQKDDLIAGTDSLILYLQKSETLTEEQIELIIKKLTDVVGNIKNINLENRDMSAIENAIADIKNEIQQQEEEAKIEKEKHEKEEQERLEIEEQERLEKEEQERLELVESKEEAVQDNQGDVVEEQLEGENEDGELEEEGQENLDEEEITDEEEISNGDEETEDKGELLDETEIGKEELPGETEIDKGNPANKDQNEPKKEEQKKPNPSQPQPKKESESNVNGKNNQGGNPQKPNKEKKVDEEVQANNEQVRKEIDSQLFKLSSILLGLQGEQSPAKDTNNHQQIKNESKLAVRNENPSIVE